MENVYLSGQEAARIAGLSPARFCILAQEGRGPDFVTIAGRRVYTTAAVEAWAKARGSVRPGRRRKGNLRAPQNPATENDSPSRQSVLEARLAAVEARTNGANG